jgi:type II secretory pathway component PulF
MPYYSWRGVDLNAQYQKGMSFARSTHELKSLLLLNNIALMAQKPRRWQFFVQSVPLNQKVFFFKQLAVLLTSGLLVPKALHLVMLQTGNKRLKEILYAIHVSVDEGHSLADSLQEYPHIFSKVMVRMVHVGEQTGALGAALTTLAQHVEALQHFMKKIKATLFLPLITLGFFMILVTIMVVVVVPQFSHLFKNMGHEMPQITQALLLVSNLLRSWWSLPIIIAIIFTPIGIWHILKSSHNKQWLDKQLLRTPIIGTLIGDMAIAQTTQSLSLLLSGGMHIIPALQVAASMMGNESMRSSFEQVCDAVGRGISLSESFALGDWPFAQEEICALLAVGQESGNLGVMLAQIAQMYQEKVERKLQTVTLIVQPALMLMLGILTLFVLISLYAPLFSMAHHI